MPRSLVLSGLVHASLLAALVLGGRGRAEEPAGRSARLWMDPALEALPPLEPTPARPPLDAPPEAGSPLDPEPRADDPAPLEAPLLAPDEPAPPPQFLLDAVVVPLPRGDDPRWELYAGARRPEPAAAAPAPAPLRVDGDPPVYPERSLRRGEEGTVLCRLHLASDGAVTSVEVVESSGFERLDRAAAAALARWRVLRTAGDARELPASILHPVTFRLE